MQILELESLLSRRIAPENDGVRGRVQHENPDHAKWTLVDWTLGTNCNFRCSYCPDSLHDGKYAFPSPHCVAQVGRVLLDHYAALGRSVFLQFTGGEVSLYPQLLSVLTELRKQGLRCGVISNGSRGVNYWSELVKALDSVVLTHHVEFANFDRFLEVASFVSERIRTHIQITMLPERFDECMDRARAMREACPKATMGLKPLRLGFGSELYVYTPEQLSMLRKPQLKPSHGLIAGSVRGMMRLENNGIAESLSAGRILARGLNRWQGWSCSAGLELLAISANGDVHRGLCREGGCLGNINTSFQLPSENILCGRDSCTCLTDILTTKFHPASKQSSVVAVQP